MPMELEWIICVYCQHLGWAREEETSFTCRHCEGTFEITESCKVHNVRTTCPKCLHVDNFGDKTFCECPECGYRWENPSDDFCHKCGVYGRKISLHTGEDLCLACGLSTDTASEESVLEDMYEG
ncbi:MAG: hypothetical protein QNJ36_03090 [Calothrix sp. MO_167.B42]|nr:hypothetical protein [Calothrix sp. MO_167.B42]